MNVAGITLHNWMRFRGRWTFKLGPTAYAVVAEEEGNPERSNWIGKTSLLEAVKFVLTGKHRHKLADDWITDDELEGGVELHFDDGGPSAIRTRVRGSSTQLTVGEAKGDEAQQLIRERMGMSEEDWFVTCYLEQKNMARFVRDSPAERYRTVSRWIGADKLGEAQAYAAQQLRELLGKEAAIEAELQAAKGSAAMLLADWGGDVYAAQDWMSGQWAECSELEARLKVARLMASELREQEKYLAQKEIRERAQDRIEQVKGKIAGLPPVAALTKEMSEANAHLGEAAIQARGAQEKVRQLRVLAAGKFDGRCPVALIPCPAKEEINDKVEESKVRLKEAERFAADAASTHSEFSGKVEELHGQMREASREVSELESLKVVLSDLHKPKKAAIKEEPEDVGALERDLATRKLTVEMTETAIRKHEAATAKVDELGAKLSALLPDLATWRATVKVMAEAKRRVSQRALEEIRDGVNAAMAEAGIELEADVSWSRETSGLATSCGDCGEPLPASRKVKQCPRCGAERGAKLEEKLEVGASADSGAAEDLVGIYFVLAASAWLRRERGARWSCALIDEPFGELDAANRKALAQHVVTGLRTFGFDQALVVAHQQGVLDALPGRVSIVGGKDGSRIAEVT